jgi:hypothetical protein
MAFRKQRGRERERERERENAYDSCFLFSPLLFHVGSQAMGWFHPHSEQFSLV